MSLMKSCGMYDFSGEWSYSVGLPAKSGVGGCIFLVIPSVMGIAIFSPRLDERGNSVRGIETAKKLLEQFSFHIYDSVKGVVTPFDKKTNPCKCVNEDKYDFISFFLLAIARNDNHEIERMLEEAFHGEFDINALRDYDDVTPAHVACSTNNVTALKILSDHGADFFNVKDRWGITPIERARLSNSQEILEILAQSLEAVK